MRASGGVATAVWGAQSGSHGDVHTACAVPCNINVQQLPINLDDNKVDGMHSDMLAYSCQAWPCHTK